MGLLRMIHNANITNDELLWINLFFNVYFPWRQQIESQISLSSISREYFSDAIFIYFDVPTHQRTLPKFSYSVPIEFLVQHIYQFKTEVGSITYDNTRLMNFSCKGGNVVYPTSFMLHIFDGSVQKLEIFNWDNSIIDPKKICIGRCDYWISPDFAGISV